MTQQMNRPRRAPGALVAGRGVALHSGASPTLTTMSHLLKEMSLDLANALTPVASVSTCTIASVDGNPRTGTDAVT